MDNMIFVILICIAIPLLLSMAFLDRRSRLFVTYMIIGAFMCTFAAQLNSLLRELSGENYLYVTTNITPISEELLKALPVMLYAMTFSDDKKYLMPVAVATGIGFAIIENIFIFVQNGSSLNILWAIQRVFGASLMHGLCTAAVGYGISFVRRRKKLFYTGTFALLVAAMVYHSTYNMIVQSVYSRFSFLLPVLTYLPITVQHMLGRRKKTEKNPAPVS